MLDLATYVDAKHAITRLEISGSLDTETSAQFAQETAGIFSSSMQMIIMDMANLEYISSAGLREIFKLAKSAKLNGISCAAVNRQPQITRVFDIVKALPDLHVFKDRLELDEYLKSMQDQVKL